MRHAAKIPFLGAAVALAAATAWATPPLSQSDHAFANDAAQAGLAEVKLGKIALERAQNAEVKKFAQTMVDDHTKVNEQLKALAKTKGITLRDDPNEEQKKTALRLEKLTGAEFDREYSKIMLDEHKKAVALFKEKGTKCEDVDLKQFATRTLPALEQHLKHAEHLSSQIGATPKDSKMPGVEH